MRNFDPGRRQLCNRRHPVKNLLECQVLATQNVTFPGSTAIEGDHVHARYFGNVNQVQPCIDVRRESPVQEIHDDSASRRWLCITRPDWRGGIQNHYVLSCSCGMDRLLLSQE